MTTQQDALSEALGRSLEPSAVMVKAMFDALEGCHSTTTAVKALIAALCELDAIGAATALESQLEAIAADELASM